jgi:hypothetical protein
MFNALRSESRREALAVLTVAGLGLVFVGLLLLRQTQIPPTIRLIPAQTGQTELCLSCHNGIEPISASHSIEEFGCVSCHGGSRLSLSQDAAHEGMVVNPASLDTAQQYCGSCHAAQVALVERSIMTTYAGAISLVRRAFGSQTSGDAIYAAHAIGNLQTFAPAESDAQPIHDFAANCQTCHVIAEPQHEQYFYRSTGCSTCHVLYGDEGLYQGGDPTISTTEAGHPQTHQFTTAIPYTQCNHCHNRGNYDLRTMEFLPREDMPADPPLTGDAQRVHDYYQPIGEFTRCEWELDCIDCHTSNEIMGDGTLYNNRSEAQYTQCSTCHGTLDAPPQSHVIEYEDEIAMTRANLNALVDLAVGDTILVTERNEPLYNIRLVDGEWVLTGKAAGANYSVPLVTGSSCQQDPNDQSSASCHECHTYDREALR